MRNPSVVTMVVACIIGSVILCVSAIPAEAAGNYYGVIVGISDYVGTWNDLNYCDDDARELHQQLLQDGGRWSATRMQLILDSQATEANINAAIANVAGQADAEDFFLFFFSGHGGQDTDRVPLDETDGLDEFLFTHEEGYLTDDEFADSIQTMLCQRILVLIDSCHSGGMVNLSSASGARRSDPDDDFATDLMRRVNTQDVNDSTPRVVALTASRADEYSQESGELQNGVFAYYLLESLVGGADTAGNGNGEISAQECYDYLYGRVIAYNDKQHPRIYSGYPTPPLEYYSVSGHSVTITSGPSGTPNPVASAGDVQCEVEAQCNRGHGLTYEWNAQDNGGSPAGAFDDASKRNPIWTSPANDTTEVVEYTLSVTITCTEGASAYGSYTQRVNGQRPGGDAFEPDDTAGQARDIPTDGSRQDHTFHVGGDVDWLAFVAEIGKTYVIETFVGDADTYLYLYDTDATTVIDENDDGGAGTASRIQWVCGTGGTYYLKVRHYNEAEGTGSYQISVTATGGPGEGDAFEPDNTSAEAKVIATDGPRQERSLHVARDVDWISFEAEAGRGYTIQTFVGTADTYMYLYDTDASTVLSENDDDVSRGGKGQAKVKGAGGKGADKGTAKTLGSTIEWNCETSGTYYVKVRDYDEFTGTGTYELSVLSGAQQTGDEFEPDNTSAEAAPITTDGSCQERSLHVMGDVDWISFEAEAGRAYTIQTFVGTADTYMYLYDTDASTVLAENDDDVSRGDKGRGKVKGAEGKGAGKGTAKTLGSTIEWNCDTSGTYYVKVRDYDEFGGTGTYELSVLSAAQPTGDEFEPDNTPGGAKEIATDGTRQARTIHAGRDVDWIKFTATGGIAYRIETACDTCDTYMYLYDTDAATLLGENDDGGVGLGSRLGWRCPSDGTYYIMIREYDAVNGTGSYELFVEESGVPAAPTDLTAVVDASAHVVLNWTDNSDDEDGFTLQRRRRHLDGSWPVSWTMLRRLGADVTTFTDEALSEGGWYQYRIRAHAGGIPSNWTSSGRVFAASTRPSAPTDFLAEIQPDNTVELSWSNTAANARGFVLQRRGRNENGLWLDWNTLGRLGLAVQSFVDDTITEDGCYQYRVRAYNAIGPSSWSPRRKVWRVTSEPRMPGNVMAGWDFGDTITLDWTHGGNDAQGFLIQRRMRNADGTWPAWATLVRLPAYTFTYDDTPVALGEEYQYRVRALNRLGPSKWAPPVRIETSAVGTAAIASVTTQQVNGQCVSVVYGLTGAAEVTVEVRNIAGRLVKVIPCGTAAAGLNTATWNLRNGAGAPVPSGLYLCTVTARSEDGSQASAVRTVSVRR